MSPVYQYRIGCTTCGTVDRHLSSNPRLRRGSNVRPCDGDEPTCSGRLIVLRGPRRVNGFVVVR